MRRIVAPSQREGFDDWLRCPVAVRPWLGQRVPRNREVLYSLHPDPGGVRNTVEMVLPAPPRPLAPRRMAGSPRGSGPVASDAGKAGGAKVDWRRYDAGDGGKASPRSKELVRRRLPSRKHP